MGLLGEPGRLGITALEHAEVLSKELIPCMSSNYCNIKRADGSSEGAVVERVGVG